jgi:tyrosinase
VVADEAGNKVLERRDVWTLSREDDWHPIIRWYERAVRALQEKEDLSNPRSWLHLANIHGTFMRRRDWPRGLDKRAWNACQHGSWFFLPWHRMYLHHFEKIVRDAIVELGGPRGWALPFWNYNAKRPETLTLPPAFRARKTPANKDNALFVSRRRQSINDGEPLDADDVETSGWADRFTAESEVIPTFGGPKTGWTHSGPAIGQLELEPHGLVHVGVGGTDGNPQSGGFMSFFELAARDPIFWLHHANVDRLWEAWRNERSRHRNPRDKDWLSAVYSFGSGKWLTTLKVRDVVDTTSAPLLYRYQGVAVPEEARELVAETATSGEREAIMPEEESIMNEEEIRPELVGASDTKIPLGEGPTVVGITTSRPRRPITGPTVAADEGVPERVYLTLENVTATSLGAGTYLIHVNVPEGSDPRSRPDRRVGKISTFGLMEASRSDDVHAGSGATFSFEITDIVRRLEAADDWDPDEIRVSITPRDADAGESARGVEIGRVGVYYG